MVKFELKHGNRGWLVVDLQRKLGVLPTSGRYLDITRSAVGKFQQAHGMQMDGIASYQVLKMLGCEPLLGVDVSLHQGTDINWRAIADFGVRFAYIKAAEGKYNGGAFDKRYSEFWLKNSAAARAHGIVVGAYFFGHKSNKAGLDADNLLKALGGKVPDGDLPPAIDFERATLGTQKELDGWAAETARHLAAATNRVPSFYSYMGFMRDRMGGCKETAPLTRLWVARYRQDKEIDPGYTGAWPEWSGWQFTSSGQIPGVGGRLDLNWLRGGEAALAHLVQHRIGC